MTCTSISSSLFCRRFARADVVVGWVGAIGTAGALRIAGRPCASRWSRSFWYSLLAAWCRRGPCAAACALCPSRWCTHLCVVSAGWLPCGNVDRTCSVAAVVAVVGEVVDSPDTEAGGEEGGVVVATLEFIMLFSCAAGLLDRVLALPRCASSCLGVCCTWRGGPTRQRGGWGLAVLRSGRWP